MANEEKLNPVEELNTMIIQSVLKRLPKALMCAFERMNADDGKKLINKMLTDFKTREKNDGLTAMEKKARLTLEQFAAIVYNQR